MKLDIKQGKAEELDIVAGEAVSSPSPVGYQKQQTKKLVESLKSIGRSVVKGGSLDWIDLPGEEDPTTQTIVSLAPYIATAMASSGISNVPAIAGWGAKALSIPKIGRFIPLAIQSGLPQAAVGFVKGRTTPLKERLERAKTEGLIGAGAGILGEALQPARILGKTTGMGQKKIQAAIDDPSILATMSKEETQKAFGASAKKGKQAFDLFVKRAERYINKARAGLGNINVMADDVVGATDDVERSLGVQPQFVGKTKGQIKVASEKVAQETKMGVDKLKEHAMKRIETAINSPKMLTPFETKTALEIADSIDNSILSLEKSMKATDIIKLPQKERDILRLFSSDLRQLSQSKNLNGKTAYELRNIMDELIGFQKEGGLSKTAKNILYDARTKINKQLISQYKEFGGAMLESSELLNLFEKMGATPKTVAGFERALKNYNNLAGETKQYLSTLDMKLPEAQQFLAKTLNVNAQRDLVSQSNPALKVARELRRQITDGTINLKEADRILQMVNKTIDSPAIDETTRSSLNALKRQLQTKITKNAPAYVRANKNLEEVTTVLSELGAAPKTEGGFQALLETWNKMTEAEKAALSKLDAAAKTKFLSDAVKLNLRKEFMEFMPEGSVARTFAAGGLGGMATTSLLAGRPDILLKSLPFLATTSPYIVGQGIKATQSSAGQAIQKVYPYLPKVRHILGNILTGTF